MEIEDLGKIDDHVWKKIYKIKTDDDQEVKGKGENFNIFKILRMQRKEVGTHSRVLHDLLNPNGSHDQGNIFLKLFLHEVLAIENFEFSNIEVTREKTATAIKSQRRIDFYIDSKSHIIGIEMKIDAADEISQLYDYYQEIEKRAADKDKQTIKLFYLTLDGHVASATSLQASKGDRPLERDKYAAISFADHILPWLDKCLEQCEGKEVLHGAITQYKILIEELTGRRIKLSGKIAKYLIENQEALRALSVAQQGFKEAKKQIQVKFWNQLILQLETPFIDLSWTSEKETVTKVNEYYNGKRKEMILSFTTETLKAKNLQFCIRLYNAIHYGLKWTAGQNDKLVELQDKGNLAAAYKEEGWAISFYGDKEDDTVNFRDFNDAAISFTDGPILDERVKSMVSHLKEIAEATIVTVDGAIGLAGDYIAFDLANGTEEKFTSAPAGGWGDKYKTTHLLMRRIPKGTFTMGSPENELGRESDETAHQVTLTQDYYIGVFELTQAQYKLITGSSSQAEFGSGSDSLGEAQDKMRPMENVSYNDIRGTSLGTHWPANNQVDSSSVLGKLRAKFGGKMFDLPTEAQWEYACRAGTIITALNSGNNLTSTGTDPELDKVGWYWSNNTTNGETYGTKVVGRKAPNNWGLYDMHGNVWEWCLDWWDGDSYGSSAVTDPKGATSGSNRNLRGGGWGNFARDCRSARRNYSTPSYGNNRTSGLRLVLPIGQ